MSSSSNEKLNKNGDPYGQEVRKKVVFFEKLHNQPTTNLSNSQKTSQKPRNKIKNPFQEKNQINLFEIADEYHSKKNSFTRKNPKVITDKVLKSYEQELYKQGSFINGIIKQLDDYRALCFSYSRYQKSYVKLYDSFAKEVDFVTAILKFENPEKSLMRETAITILNDSFKKPAPKSSLPESIQQARRYEAVKWPNYKNFRSLYEIAKEMQRDLAEQEKFMHKKRGNKNPIDWNELFEGLIENLDKHNKKVRSTISQVFPSKRGR